LLLAADTRDLASSFNVARAPPTQLEPRAGATGDAMQIASSSKDSTALVPFQSGYHATLHRLSHSSISKHFHPYRDIDWDAPEHRIDPRDPRFCLREDSPLGQSAWYRGLPEATRVGLGLELQCQTFKYGIGLESALIRGMLEFVHDLPNGSNVYRYAMHEVIEECQHSLMFQEFIDRARCDPVPIMGLDAFVNRRVARAGATFPAFYFFCVLSSEIFIDDEQREQLKQPDLHPLLRAILRCHVTEEARHLCFARLYLERCVPSLSRTQRAWLRTMVPGSLRSSERMLMRPSPRLVRRYSIPREVLRDCFGPGTPHQQRMQRIAAPALALLSEPRSGSVQLRRRRAG
jgi:P-aminobenzoate N-oxygenase AurF